MQVLVIVACLAAAAAGQFQHTSHFEKVVEASAQPQYDLVFQQQQQPASLLVKSLEQQVPVGGYQQTAFVSGQPASFLKTVEKIENAALLNGQVHKFEKIEGAQKVELPAVAAYSGGYEHSAYVQKQPALATLAGYKTVAAQPEPAVATYVKEFVAPVVSTYSAQQPAAYKQDTLIASKPVLTSYKKDYVASAAFPAEYKHEQSTVYSAAPVLSYSVAPQESLIAVKPAVSIYKKEFAAPAVASYKKEIYSAPAVDAFPGAYKQETLIAAKPAVASYSAFPGAYKQETLIAAKPAVASYSYSAFPGAYKQETLIAAKPAVASYSAFPGAYKQETLIATKPAVFAYGAAFQKDSLLYSQAAKYGGSAMFAGQSAEGASSILKLYNDDMGTGIYQYGYATSNGISHDVEGKVLASSTKSAESAEGSAAVTGSYSYTGPDGVLYTVKYIADEQGFRAYGDHLPKLSEEAQRAIDESAKHAEEKDY